MRCPFCGGFSKLEPKSKTMIKGQLTYVTYCRCVKCDSRGSRIIIEDNPIEARRLAVESWNRRVYEN